MSTLVRAEPSVDRIPAQRQVTHSVQQLVTDKFIRIAKRRGIENLVFFNENRILQRRTECISGLLKRVAVARKSKRAGMADIFGEPARRPVENHAL